MLSRKNFFDRKFFSWKKIFSKKFLFCFEIFFIIIRYICIFWRSPRWTCYFLKNNYRKCSKIAIFKLDNSKFWCLTYTSLQQVKTRDYEGNCNFSRSIYMYIAQKNKNFPQYPEFSLVAGSIMWNLRFSQCSTHMSP